MVRTIVTIGRNVFPRSGVQKCPREKVGRNVSAMGGEIIAVGRNLVTDDVITTGSNVIITTTAQPTLKSTQLDCNITNHVIVCCQLSTYSPALHDEREK